MISLTLPSIYPDALARTLINLRDSTRDRYQVIVVSPFEPPSIVKSGSEITWVRETEPKGCNSGHAAAAPHVRGDYVVAWVDDHLLIDGWDLLAVREFETTHVYPQLPIIVGLRQVHPEQVGTVFGWYYAYFPMMESHHLASIGWFDPEFREDFADCDLALRVKDSLGCSHWSETATVVVHHDDSRKAGRSVNQNDMQRFLSRHAEKFGKFWKTQDLRDFNLDFSLSDRRWVDDRLEITGRTIVPRRL